MRIAFGTRFLVSLVILVAAFANAEEIQSRQEEPLELEHVEVTAQRVANLQPASSYAATVTELRFDPQIDVQARGLPEGQAYRGTWWVVRKHRF